MGGVFGLAVAVAVFSAEGGVGSPEAFTHGFAPALKVRRNALIRVCLLSAGSRTCA